MNRMLGKTVVVLAIAALSIKAALAADAVPQFDIHRLCRSAPIEPAMTKRDAPSCENDENSARTKVESDWAQYSSAERARCVRLVTLGGSPSYVELATCLEMSKLAPSVIPDAVKSIEKPTRGK